MFAGIWLCVLFQFSTPLGAAESLVATNGPTISLMKEGAQVRIAYTGILQWSSALGSGWSDLTNVPNPYVADLSQAQGFFRTRDIASIFGSEEIVSFSVTGPLQQHFDLAFAGMPDGIFPPVREKPYFDGFITIGDEEIPVSLRVRGNSSLQECPFPKMKFKVSRAERVGTPFFDAREVKIGTHCAEGGRGPIGRLRDERATYREALAYEAMQILGFVSPRVRRARIEYHDATATNSTSEVGWDVTRNAVILDDIEVVAERLGGRALDDEEITVLTNANFDVQLLTDLEFFHILLGNWDYVLAPDGRGIWNTDVIELPDLKLLPVAGDFDLCSFVTGEVRLDVPWDYRPEMPPLERQARYDLEQLKARLSEQNPTFFTNAAARFESKRTALEGKVNSVVMDEQGRTNALQHVTAFFTSLAVVTQDRK
jgi:hypothetical protein